MLRDPIGFISLTHDLAGEIMFGCKYDHERLQRIPSILFSYKAQLLKTLRNNFIKHHESLGIPKEEQVDAREVI